MNSTERIEAFLQLAIVQLSKIQIAILRLQDLQILHLGKVAKDYSGLTRREIEQARKIVKLTLTILAEVREEEARGKKRAEDKAILELVRAMQAEASREPIGFKVPPKKGRKRRGR